MIASAAGRDIKLNLVRKLKTLKLSNSNHAYVSHVSAKIVLRILNKIFDHTYVWASEALRYGVIVLQVYLARSITTD